MSNRERSIGDVTGWMAVGLAVLALTVAPQPGAADPGDDGDREQPQPRVLIDPTAVADSDAYAARGFEHLSRGAAALAVSDLEAAIEIHAHNARANLGLGMAMVRIGRHSEARRYFEQALRLDPQLYVETHELAVAYATLGNYVRARTILSRILQARPADVEALYLDGRLAVRTDDLDAGMATLARVLELEPAHPRAATEIGLAHLRSSEPQTALVALQRANAILINQRAVLHGMIRAYELLGSEGEAATFITRFESLRPAWEGIEQERDHLRRNPRDPATYERIGRHMIRLRHFEPACGMLETAILLDPDRVPARRALGTAYNGRQMFGEAEVVLHEALALSPDDPAIHRELSMCYRFTGSFKLAERHQHRALELQARADSLQATPAEVRPEGR